MSSLTIAEARSLIETDLQDADLQAVIDREEEWLAGRIGQLAGARSQTFYVYGEDRPLRLQRPTAALTTVVDHGVLLTAPDFLLLGGGFLVERTRRGWDGPIVVTYAPNDAGQVDRITLELVRLTIASSPYTSERRGNYSYSKPDMAHDTAIRAALVNDLLKRGPAGGATGTTTTHTPTPWVSQRVSQVVS